MRVPVHALDAELGLIVAKPHFLCVFADSRLRQQVFGYGKADDYCSNKGIDNRNKGTDNRNKGTDNRTKGTDNRNKGTDNRKKGTANSNKGTDNRDKGTDYRSKERPQVRSAMGRQLFVRRVPHALPEGVRSSQAAGTDTTLPHLHSLGLGSPTRPAAPTPATRAHGWHARDSTGCLAAPQLVETLVAVSSGACYVCMAARRRHASRANRSSGNRSSISLEAALVG